MKRTGRALTAGCLTLAWAGFLALPGAGVAHAQPLAAPAACTELATAVKAFNATLQSNEKKFQADHAAYVAAVDNYGNQVLKITSQGSAAAQSAAKTYVTELEAEVAANDLNPAKITAESDRLAVLLCTPKGAPRTGGGSSAGLQYPALFGTGGAIALAGLVVVGLAVRNRPRTSADHG
jgi:hypothetical protein